MEWDEPPVFQSLRFKRYDEIAERLLNDGLAYRCECKAQELDRVRQRCAAEKKAFRYPGTCKNKNVQHRDSVLRIRFPTEGETAFDDCIRGTITFQNRDIDDWVIQRSDGSPTYNFAVVVDDHDQSITHVLRGDDHINNTPKQIQLYRGLGFELPRFAHLPMILGPDRTKLSKRHSAASTLEYRKMGYLPAAIINFLVRLGWSHGDQELFKIEELKTVFSLDRIGKANAIFNPEKLSWISGHFFRETPAQELSDYLVRHFESQIVFGKAVEHSRWIKGISIIQGKVKLIPELIDQLQCLFGPDPKYDPLPPTSECSQIVERLSAAMRALEKSSFQKEGLEHSIREVCVQRSEKLAPIAQALRFAVTGGKISPGLFEMLEVQGKETVTKRLHLAISALTGRSE